MAMTSELKENFILIGVFGLFTLALMVARLLLRKIQKHSLSADDYLTAFAFICFAARMTIAVLILLWGTNSTDLSVPAGGQFKEPGIHHREMGSKLALANRVVYATYIWTQKAVIIVLYNRIPPGLLWPGRILTASWVALAVTFILVLVMSFSECSPFHLYWQVVPDPGTCAKATLHSYIHTGANALTDLILITIPLPWILRESWSRTQKSLLFFLLFLGLFLIAFAFSPLPVVNQNTSRTHQNALQNAEAFLLAFLANIITIAGLDRRYSAEDDDIDGIDHHDVPWPNSYSNRFSTGSGFRSLFDKKIIVTSKFELQHQTVSPSRVRQMFPRHPWTTPKRMSDENLIIQARGGSGS
ncbi:hypothetical protein AJ79_07536 [Helicocarpus griseus UAMH5409]|uniref:Rhodopsin domain-containing protein n=1 Tax=Helicocarpus griseus UAMH5409 TaxID=1447875 RepID=A0A2B7X1W0_9EURO|nr:hypothetical protein AJ79_07536 [Helicocarpus griseus UAMH5409]